MSLKVPFRLLREYLALDMLMEDGLYFLTSVAGCFADTGENEPVGNSNIRKL